MEKWNLDLEANVLPAFILQISNNHSGVSVFTQHYGLSSALALLGQLVLHSKTRNCVGGGNPGDDKAAGGNFSH